MAFETSLTEPSLEYTISHTCEEKICNVDYQNNIYSISTSFLYAKQTPKSIIVSRKLLMK